MYLCYLNRKKIIVNSECILAKKLNNFLKRAFDIVASLCGLIILSPVMSIVAIIIKLDSPGPVFYIAERTGRYAIPFKITKFRTMVAEADKMGGGSTTALNDPRFTRTGRFLGKYKLNELPQLINVLRGEMSIVGPRPQVDEYTKLYNDEEKIILSVCPGITDYASVKFIDLEKTLGEENVDEKYFREIEPKKNRLRIKYARENSLLIDLHILFKTIIALLGLKIHGIRKIRDD